MDIKKKTAAAPAETRQYVTFRVGSEEYGLDINAIAEVIRPLKITPLPRMPQFVEGVVNLRGTIIPVVDLRKRFAVKAAQDDPRKVRMVITKGALQEGAAGRKALLGLVVDGVSEVLHLSPDQIDRAPEAATGRNADFIAGMGKLGDRLIILIDLVKILTRQERVALAEAGRDENEKVGR
jgi:purine-binding chemotaxis protein CheW